MSTPCWVCFCYASFNRSTFTPRVLSVEFCRTIPFSMFCSVRPSRSCGTIFAPERPIRNGMMWILAKLLDGLTFDFRQTHRDDWYILQHGQSLRLEQRHHSVALIWLNIKKDGIRAAIRCPKRDLTEQRRLQHRHPGKIVDLRFADQGRSSRHAAEAPSSC